MNRVLVLALVLSAGFCSFAEAQQNVPPQPAPTAAEQKRLEELQGQFDRLRAEAGADDAEPAAGTEDDDTAADAAYDAWVLDYTRGAYAWHHTSTVVIFWVVMILVLSGVALATWQLGAWIKRMKSYDEIFLEQLRKTGRADVEAINGIGKAPDNTLNLTKQSVALSSPYVGVVILGLSMGFFLAYLLLVYPIVQGP
jgi:hypothetical protein